MLKNIPKILSPALLKVLMEMGHGDEIVLADGNYPAASNATILIRQDGLGMVELLTAILTLFPIDTYVESGITLMEVVPGDTVEPIIWEEYQKVIKGKMVENETINFKDRNAFYEQGKQAYAILATGEEALYANIILRKGVVNNTK